MTEKRLNPKTPGSFSDSTLDVAIDPKSLDAFIDAWNAAGLEQGIAHRPIEDIEELGPNYYDYLSRAVMFLQRGEASQPDLQSVLDYFDSQAAFIVDTQRKIVEANVAAQEWLGPQAEGSVIDIGHSDDERSIFRKALNDAFASDLNFKRVLKVHEQEEQNPTLLQVCRLTQMERSDRPKVLVVSSQRY